MRCVLLIFVLFVNSSHVRSTNITAKSYAGYRLYRLFPSDEQRPQLRSLESCDGFDFWSNVPGSNVDVMVSPNRIEEFHNFLSNIQLSSEILINNLEEELEKEREAQMTSRLRKSKGLSFTRFLRYNEIRTYLSKMERQYPHIVKTDIIGKTYEGRPMRVIKISASRSKNCPVILIDAGIHAREWIAPAMALYIINQLVENRKNNYLISGVEWHIIPVLNPDGYEYTHTQDRMWRKTRSKGVRCYGVDPNRNFDYHWNEAGTSTNECSEIYSGPRPFSEIEMRNLRDYALRLKPRTKVYLTFHSFGNMFLYPWGYAKVLPPNVKQLHSLAEAALKAHRMAGGDDFKLVGSSAGVLYEAAGGSDDWMMARGGAQYSYTLELTDHPKGFVLPEHLILPTVQKFFEAVRVIGNFVKETYRTRHYYY